MKTSMLWKFCNSSAFIFFYEKISVQINIPRKRFSCINGFLNIMKL